jgi:RNA polymerase sigma-70 factor, ECF subfamily
MKEKVDATLWSVTKEPSQKDKEFLQWMEDYKKPIYWHIRRMVVSHHDAEDILQETFIQAYRHAGSFKGESKVYTWLYRIATNECIKHFRKNKRRIKNGELFSGTEIDHPSEADMENSDTILMKFQQAILQIPERQRIVFNLRYYDELSYEDIGQILNSSVNSLKTNYHFACERVKKYLIEHA